MLSAIFLKKYLILYIIFKWAHKIFFTEEHENRREYNLNVMSYLLKKNYFILINMGKSGIKLNLLI